MMASAVAKNAIRLTGKPQRLCGYAIVGVLEKFTESDNPGFEQLQSLLHSILTKARSKMRYRNDKISL
jgi:hypothetical protein